MNYLLAAILICLCANPCAAEATKPGRAVFEGLPDASGHVLIGSNEVATSRFPCRSCHRRDGRGGTEGDVPPINWETLSRPSATRPAYDAASFAHLLATGETPSGRKISRLMPRYALDGRTVNSLVAHLSSLTAEQKAGIHPDRIVFGVPIADHNASNGHLLIRALETALAVMMPPNGLRGRRVEIRPLRGDASSMLNHARTETAAILSPLPSDVLDLSFFTDAGVPVLFPIAAVSENEDPTLVRSFYASQERVVELLVRKGVADGCRRMAIAAASPAKAAQIQARIPQPDMIETTSSSAFADCIVIVGGSVTPKLRDKAGRLYVRSEDFNSLQAMLRDFHGTIIVGRHEAAALGLAAAKNIGPIQAHAMLIAAALHDALTSAGRDLTRASLVLEIGAVSRPDLGLEFLSNSPTGLDSVVFQVFEVGRETMP